MHQAAHQPKQPSLTATTTSTPASTPASSGIYFKVFATAIALVAVTLAFSSPLRTTLRSLPTKFPSLVRTMATTTSTSTSTSTSQQTLQITPRPNSQRGHADHGWLHTHHTFSFASYYDPSHPSFGPLRVINEDRVLPGTGFGAHSHAEFLIWSYIVSGELEHKDSMGNLEHLHRGQVQFTSAGTGIRHSEYNRNTKEEVHFLQIWAKPNVSGLTPKYVTRTFTDEEKRDRLVRIVESVDREKEVGEQQSAQKTTTQERPIPLHADVSMSAAILSPGKQVVHDLVQDGERKVYVHLVMTSGRTQPKTGGAAIQIGGAAGSTTVLKEGDGAYVTAAKGSARSIVVESVGEKPAEFLLFDMGA